MNVQPIDLGDELRQGVQPCLALAPVVFRAPVTRERLCCGELHSLRGICDGFSFGPSGCVDARPQFLQFLFWNIHLWERTDCVLVSSGFSHALSPSVCFLNMVRPLRCVVCKDKVARVCL